MPMQPGMGRCSVLVIGDEALVRSISAAARVPRFLVRGSIPASVAVAAGIRPDVVVAGIDGPAGLGTIEEATASFPSVPRVAATSGHDLERFADAIVLGACGFLDANDAGPRIVDVLRRAAAGEIVVDAERLGGLLETRGVDDGGRSIASLTSRERDVLRLIAEGAGTSDIATALGITPATVQTHVRSVLRKLGVRSKVEAARFAWRAGVTPVPAPV